MVEMKPLPKPDIITVAGPVFALFAISIAGLREEEVKYSVPCPIIMYLPAKSPVITENESPTQLLNPNKYSMPKVITAIKTALILTPLLRESISCFTVASSFVFTENIP